MKHMILSLYVLCFTMLATAQNQWFSTYRDSTTLVNDANAMIQKMSDHVLKVNPKINLHQNIAIKNTTPYLIFIDSSTVHLPLWEEVIEPQKQFFADVAGGQQEGKDVFGLFFNGFYLAHELGHSLSAIAGKQFENAYDSEYEANTLAIMYWKASDESEKLEQCYNAVLKMLKKLKNPVPENEDAKKYITENYNELAGDPYQYGYIQFSQFVEIYENQNLPEFDTYLKNYNTN